MIFTLALLLHNRRLSAKKEYEAEKQAGLKALNSN
jgi:hypothetical protein